MNVTRSRSRDSAATSAVCGEGIDNGRHCGCCNRKVSANT